MNEVWREREREREREKVMERGMNYQGEIVRKTFEI